MKVNNSTLLIKDNEIINDNAVSKIVTENLNFGSWIWYTVEDRLLFSKSFCEIAGIPQNSFYDFRTFFDIVHGNDLMQFINSIEAMLKGAAPGWIGFKIVRPDKKVQDVNCFMESLKTEFGEVFDITGICFKVI